MKGIREELGTKPHYIPCMYLLHQFAVKWRLEPACLTLSVGSWLTVVPTHPVAVIRVPAHLLQQSVSSLRAGMRCPSLGPLSFARLSAVRSELTKMTVEYKRFAVEIEGGSSHMIWVLGGSLAKVREGISGREEHRHRAGMCK